MSAVVDFIGDAIGSVAKVVTKAVKYVGNTIKGVVQGALRDPLGMLINIAAVAVAGPVAGPAIASGINTLRSGGDLGDALKNAAITAGTAWLASGVNLAGSTLGLEGNFATAANVALSGGVRAALTGQNVLEGALTAGLSTFAGLGIRDANLSQYLGALGPAGAAIGADVLGRGLAGGVNSALRGNDFGEGFSGGVTGSLTNRAFGAINSGIDRTVGSVRASAEDYWNQNISPLLATATEQRNELTDLEGQLSNATQEFTGTVEAYDAAYQDAEQRHAAIESFREQFDPLQQEARAAAEATQSATDAYNAKLAEYNDLYAQYQAASDADNVDEANRLADLLNPMAEELPTLQTAAEEAYETYLGVEERYNPVATQMQTLVDEFNNATQQVESLGATATTQRDNLQATEETYNNTADAYQQISDQINAASEDFNRLSAGLHGGSSGQDINSYIRNSGGIGNMSLEERRALADADAAYESPWANYAAQGVQQFDDGSSLQVFDDGSIRVVDADGNVQSFDEAGNLYTTQGATSSDQLWNEIDNTSQEGEEGYGWRYFTDEEGNALAIDPEGRYHRSDASEEGYNWQDIDYDPNTYGQTVSKNKATNWMKALRDTTQTQQQAQRQARNAARGSARGSAPAQPEPGSTVGGAATPASSLSDITGAGADAGADLFKGTDLDLLSFLDKNKSPLTYIEGAPLLAGEQYISLDPLSKPVPPEAGAGEQPGQAQRQGQGQGQGSSPLTAILSPYRDAEEQSPTRTSALSSLDPFNSSRGAHGGQVQGVSRETNMPPLTFMSEGGMRHVQGEGDGISDSVNALLSSGEYVLPARVVSEIGNGDTNAGAKKLDHFVKDINQTRRQMRNIAEDGGDYLGALSST